MPVVTSLTRLRHFFMAEPGIEKRDLCQWPNSGSQSGHRMTGSSSSKTNAHVCCYVNKWRKAAFYKDYIYKYTAV